jgi:hypothetical protein
MSENNYSWWTLKDDKIANSVFSYIKYLDTDQSYRQNENFKFMKMYGNFELFNLRSYQYLRKEQANNVQNRVTLNIVQSMIDTVVSKVSKNRPKPTFLTEGGDWSQQTRAKKLNQFAEGQFQATDFYSKAAIAFQDSCIFGTGCLKIFKENSEIKVERIFIDELIVDDKEAFYGEPRQMHQKKYIHKDMLIQMFPDKKYEITNCGMEQTSYMNTAQTNSDLLLVVESWRLKSGPNATDGKHCIAIENSTLFSEDYEKDYFPFVFWRWGVRPLGFFGQGISEQLQGLQLEINKILKTIQVSMHLVSIPKVFIEASSKIVDSHIDNKIGGIIKYSGNPPIPSALGSIPPELFAHLDRLYSRAYEIIGVSQLSANSSKPSGLNSGKALREFNDLETERFMSVAQRYEKAFMDAAKQMISLAKELDEEMRSNESEDSDNKSGYKVKVKGKNFIKTIKWKEVELDEDQYVMSIFPTSALSTSPASRLQDVQELIQAGFVSKEDAMKLLDFPDLEAFYNYSNAGVEDIERAIENMIDDGKYTTPEPYQNLEYGIVKMQQAYLLFRSKGAPDAKLELFRRWIEDAKSLMDRAQMEVQKQQMQAQMEAQNAADLASAQQAQAQIMNNTSAQPPMAGEIPQQAPASPQTMDSQIPIDVTMPQ